MSEPNSFTKCGKMSRNLIKKRKLTLGLWKLQLDVKFSGKNVVSCYKKRCSKCPNSKVIENPSYFPHFETVRTRFITDFSMLDLILRNLMRKSNLSKRTRNVRKLDFREKQSVKGEFWALLLWLMRRAGRRRASGLDTRKCK